MGATNCVFLSVDSAVFPPALFTAYTARQHARAHEFDIVIAVPENTIEPIWLDWAAQLGVIIKEAPLAEGVGILKTASRTYPPSCCYRYIFDIFLSPRYEKLIYLDADIRVTGDISRLFDLDLGTHPFAARPGLAVAQDIKPGSWAERYITTLGWDVSTPYASSGVLVINPQRWLDLDFGRRVIAVLRENIPICLLADESALNLLVRGDFLPISPVWNILTTHWLGTDLSDVIAPAVLHHGGHNKPWNPADWITKTGDRRETAEYQLFFRNSPFPDFASVKRRPSWKQTRRYMKGVIRRTLGRDALVNAEKYKRHIQTFPFADKDQGLTAIDRCGVLRPTAGAADL